MEFLKANPIINLEYQPALSQSYIDYFNRAMVFAQTNYNDQITKISKVSFRKMSPTSFLEEYTWIISCTDKEPLEVSGYFLSLSKSLQPFYQSFWDLNNFPKEEISKAKEFTKDKYDAIHHTASIMNRGIKLFGWDKYRDNFLNTPGKLCALPLLQIGGAKHLSRNVGSNNELLESQRLYPLVKRWGFDSSEELCKSIQKHVPMSLKVIEMILWYSAVTFESNLI